MFIFLTKQFQVKNGEVWTLELCLKLMCPHIYRVFFFQPTTMVKIGWNDDLIKPQLTSPFTETKLHGQISLLTVLNSFPPPPFQCCITEKSLIESTFSWMFQHWWGERGKCGFLSIVPTILTTVVWKLWAWCYIPSFSYSIAWRAICYYKACNKEKSSLDSCLSYGLFANFILNVKLIYSRSA